MCKNLIGRITGNWNDGFYLVLRIIAGLMFFMHGAQKVFGWFGSGPMDNTLMIVVGAGEFLVGLGIIFGVFTRLAALGGIVIMAGAAIKAHFLGTLAEKGFLMALNPLTSRAELALLYLVVFLFILAKGNGKYNLESKILKKEVF